MHLEVNSTMHKMAVVSGNMCRLECAVFVLLHSFHVEVVLFHFYFHTTALHATIGIFKGSSLTQSIFGKFL